GQRRLEVGELSLGGPGLQLVARVAEVGLERPVLLVQSGVLLVHRVLAAAGEERSREAEGGDCAGEDALHEFDSFRVTRKRAGQEGRCATGPIRWLPAK